jgi:hypothetical protein
VVLLQDRFPPKAEVHPRSCYVGEVAFVVLRLMTKSSDCTPPLARLAIRSGRV